MDESKVRLFYQKKKIFYVKLELTKDFLLSLLDKVDRTYLGDELMIIRTQREHFDYCLTTTINSFKNEEIKINKTLKMENVFFDLFFKNYYDVKKTKKHLNEFKMKISNLFSYSYSKRENQLKELFGYYEAFNQSLGDFFEISSNL